MSAGETDTGEAPLWRIPVYLFVTALSSGCGLVVEIVAGRLIAPYLGMSLYTWTAVIAVVLAGFSIGNWIGGRLADKPADRASAMTAWSLALAALSTLLVLPLLRMVAGPVLAMDLGAISSILVLTVTLFLLPSIFVGIPSPILTTLAVAEHREATGRLIGLFFAFGAVGSILGTLGAGFIFISYLGSNATLLTVAGLYAGLAAIMAFDARARSRARAATSAEGGSLGRFGVVLLIGLITAAGALIAWGTAGRAFVSACTAESDYYCLRVEDTDDQFGVPSRVLVLDHLAHGINVRDAPGVLVSPYVELQHLLTGQLFEPSAALRAYFIGGGAFTLPRAWLASYSNADLTVSEIDPMVTRLASERLWLDTADKRLSVAHVDARAWLSGPGKQVEPFDVIVGDAFHDIAVPPHLVTVEMYRLIKSRLKPGGLYLMNVIDNPDRPRMAASVVATLREVFDAVEVWVSNEPQKRATFVIRAAKTPSTERLLSSPTREGLMWQKLSERDIQGAMTRLDPIVLSDDFAPVDRLIAAE